MSLTSEDGPSTHLDIDFISAKNDWNVLADTLEITVPVRHILVCDSRRNIEHDDATLALYVITITETTELFLTCSIPDVETDGAKVGRECQGVNFDTEGGYELHQECEYHACDD